VFEHQHAGGLRQRFHDEHARHHREARKMALKEGFVLRDALDAHDPLCL
jgi:hypothetical protein